MKKSLFVLALLWAFGAPLMAQVAPSAPAISSLAPGVYVHVIDGMITLKNSGGSQNFAPGQFGFTPNSSQPPAILPKNPGIGFSLPVKFMPIAPAAGIPASGTTKSAVDCEVR